MNILSYKDEIFQSPVNSFHQLALWAFHYQYENCLVYKRYVDLLQVVPDEVKNIQQIPFLPISLFKTQVVIDSSIDSGDLIFESSTTTGQVPSKHHITDPQLYVDSFSKGFQHFFGDVRDYCILGLLPSYLERGNSSLVYMVNRLIEDSQHVLSGFYLNNLDALVETIQTLESTKQRALLFGVTFALLDLADRFQLPMNYVQIIETGGMKGRREEWTRSQVHHRLQDRFGLKEIYSEYGMTELLSQAYSTSNEIFQTVPWMKVLVRDINDPMGVQASGKGGLNIIDLANIHSCCFIATDDAGDLFADGSFKILGRLAQSELRGCSLLTV